MSTSTDMAILLFCRYVRKYKEA